MPLTIYNRDVEEISSLDQWKDKAPPKKKSHWQDFRSAKELAQAWLRPGTPEVPEELVALLEGRAETRGFLLDKAVAEMIIRLDGCRGGQRNCDLVVYGKNGDRKIVVGVEAKADEPFDVIVGKKLNGGKGKLNTNLRGRIAHLSRALFDREVDDHIRSLRYQLLHGLAAVAIEARCKKASVAVFVVHEFISLALDFEKVTHNHHDLESFIRTFPGWARRGICIGKLLPAIRLPGCGRVPNDIPILFGKIRTLIPLDSRHTARPQPGMQNQSRQYLSS